jgi:hypothetical protein
VRNLIARLSRSDQQQLLRDLNYLNINEMKYFCNKHLIPYAITIEVKRGFLKKTNENDRKGIILSRIRHYLKTGKVQPPTIFPPKVICYNPLPENLAATDKLHYGQYKKKNKAMIHLLQKLTAGKFREGAIARIVAREFWSRGKAPTFKQFAQRWLKVLQDHAEPNPEWAFLSDRAKQRQISNWKEFRRKKGESVLKILDSL